MLYSSTITVLNTAVTTPDQSIMMISRPFLRIHGGFQPNSASKLRMLPMFHVLVHASTSNPLPIFNVPIMIMINPNAMLTHSPNQVNDSFSGGLPQEDWAFHWEYQYSRCVYAYP